jgi:anti-sigma factor RsiW
VLAAQLAFDHLKCLVVAATEAGVVPAEVERQWQERRGWPIGVPASAPSLDLQLVGLRTCLYHDGHMAHVLYEHGGQRVSLFVMPQREAAAAVLSVFGQQTRTWSHDGRTYAMVADAAAGPLEAVAAYLEAHAR